MNIDLNIPKNSKRSANNYLSLIGYHMKNACSEIIENKHVKYILLLLFGFLVFSSATAKPLTVSAKYKIYMLGANVGEFSVVQTNNDGNVIIDAITEVKINLLFSYRIKYVQQTTYNHGILQNANVETYKNDKLNSTMRIKLVEGAYLLVTNGDTIIINDPITYSGSLLYFNEPNEARNIFKERNAEMRQITPVSEHTYIIKDEKEREINRYYYVDGILRDATMRHALGKVELKQVNE